MKSKLYKFFTFMTLCLSLTVSAQTWPTDTIRVSINSGNPNFPFPQFQEYTAGKSLAKYNAEGVTHADMEKAMREGYQIMMHRALYTGKVHNGVKYIVYNYGSVPQNYGTFVSEGDGYALLAAAYFGDKTTFDGLWMWIHDNRLSGVKQYYNCANLRAAYPYGKNLPGWSCTETDNISSTNVQSASDGDFDIAMALLLATKQWGENMGINDACGNPISYKAEALSMIKALVDTVYYTQGPTGIPAGVKGYLTGDIGIDGYVKSGNTWGELTNWRSSAANTTYSWAKAIPDPLGSKSQYVDYIAPAYFNEFAKFLEQNGGTNWQIDQFKRAEASSDWTIGQMFAKGFIASAGNYQLNDDGSNITFGSFAAGEDFRLSWRTILNYVWHGDATSSWNPVTHAITASANSYQKEMAIRHADFLKYPRTLPSASSSAYCSVLGASPDPSSPSWKGVAQIKQMYSPTGAVLANYGVNWMVGTGAPAAVASGDVDLLAEIYRQSEIMWDDVSSTSGMTDDQRYIKSTPKYFHDWFRLLGMLTASGNLHAPNVMAPSANVKVYLSVDKTYASAGDLVTYTLSYRNYGSVAATGLKLSIPMGTEYEFVSASNSGTLFGGAINWNIGTLPGFQTGTGIAPTQGTVSFTVKVKPLASVSRACLVGTVSANNASTWQSNAYPNNAGYTMERNCVDLLPNKALTITKTSNKSSVNVGDELTFKLQFGNAASTSSLLNGGRDKVVISYGNYSSISSTFFQFYRIWNTAQEAYINLGNYRVSYFLNDSLLVGKYDGVANPSGWDIVIDNQNELNKYGYNPSTLPVDKQIKFSVGKLAKGKDANGRWNQRVVTQFASVLTAPTSHIYDKQDSDYLIRKGVRGPSFIRTRLEAKPFADLSTKLPDDWSYSSSAANSSIDGQSSRFFPVSPTYTNAATAFAPVVVNNYSKDVCNADVANFSKVLVEEFDGYTWRRVGGSAPIYGTDASNVVVYDTIPKYLTWVGFADNLALGTNATYTAAPSGSDYTGVVKWSTSSLMVGDSAALAYKVIVKDPPCVNADVNFVNRAWIKSDRDMPLASSTSLVVKCTVTDLVNPVLVNTIEVYPNPAQDQATVDLSQYGGKVHSVELKSTAGHILYHTENAKDNISFATQSLATGVYMVEIKTDEGVMVKKLNITR